MMMRTLQIERCTIYVYRDEHGNAVYVGLTCQHVVLWLINGIYRDQRRCKIP